MGTVLTGSDLRAAMGRARMTNSGLGTLLGIDRKTAGKISGSDGPIEARYEQLIRDHMDIPNAELRLGAVPNAELLIELARRLALLMDRRDRIDTQPVRDDTNSSATVSPPPVKRG